MRKLRVDLPCVICVLMAIVLAGCGSGEDNAAQSDPTTELADSEFAKLYNSEGDGEPATPVSCPNVVTPAAPVRVVVPRNSRGAVLTLTGSTGRTHQLWIRRKLSSSQDVVVTMTELAGTINGVDITAPGAPNSDSRWAILILDFADCTTGNPASYVVAKRVNASTHWTRTGAVDLAGRKVMGWIKGTSRYIIAQG